MNRTLKLVLIASLLLNAVAGIRYLLRNFQNPPIDNTTHAFWMGRDQYLEMLPPDSLAYVFLGTSITHNFELNEHYPYVHIQNRGINGDELPGMQQRLTSILKERPLKLFIEAGINDLGSAGKRPQAIAAEMKKLIRSARSACGDRLHIYVISVLPVRNSSTEMTGYCSPEINHKIERLNELYREICADEKVTYIDAYTPLAEDGQLRGEYSVDGVHLSGKGYLRFADALFEYVKESVLQ